MTAILATSPTDQYLATEANHRIANSLTLLAGLVRMQAAGKRDDVSSNAEVRLMLEGIAARINTIGQLHRLLSSVPADGVTSLRPHLHEVAAALVSALSSSERRVTVMHTGGDCLVLVRHVQPIILILSEVVINAMKYAHPAGAALILTVDCMPSTDGRLAITVSDDGVGLPEGFDPHTSQELGFKVMRSLARKAGASLDINSTALGLSFRLALAAGAAAAAQIA